MEKIRSLNRDQKGTEHSHMKRKLIIGFCVFLVVLCLIPTRKHLEDGGTVLYKAVLYQVEDIHAIGAEETAEDEYLEGTVVRILGIEVYNNVS